MRIKENVASQSRVNRKLNDSVVAELKAETYHNFDHKFDHNFDHNFGHNFGHKALSEADAGLQCLDCNGHHHR